MAHKCKTCWWQEGEKCYNEKLVNTIGKNISPELLMDCNENNCYCNKRKALGTLIPNNKLTIISEKE